jgi:hypothetical protein
MQSVSHPCMAVRPTMSSCCSPEMPGVHFVRKQVGFKMGPVELETESQFGVVQ